MTYQKKQIASWEIKYGQISLTGRNYISAKSLFEPYLAKTFELVTFLGNFPNRHFVHESTKNSLRLACVPFFSKLEEGQLIYFQPIDDNKIGVYNSEPTEKMDTKVKIEKVNSDVNYEHIIKHLYELSKENKELRTENEELLKYKDRIEKYENLDYIFEDEKFMEDWLERNIHKAISNLEIIDRQPTNVWVESFMRDKPDFFCIDRTTKEFVIVENKIRGRNRTVDTQFLKYRAWVKRNIEVINEKYKEKGIKATGKFKFVIITDTTDDRLEAICEDNYISLIHIDGGVIFDPIVPYHFDT
jgi:hypothetical protein